MSSLPLGAATTEVAIRPGANMLGTARAAGRAAMVGWKRARWPRPDLPGEPFASRPSLTIELPDDQPISPRLTGVGSLRPELESVFFEVPGDASADDYRRAILETNAAGKNSSTARLWAWRRLKLRYALDRPESEEFQAFRVAINDPSPAGRGLSCALMFARLDRLFREVTLARLSPMLGSAGTVVDPIVVRAEIEARMSRANLRWGDGTLAAVTSHLLSAWKDFGLVTGSKVRRTAIVQPMHPTIVFAATLGRLEGLTDRQILGSRWFALLGLTEADVATLMYDAARAGALGFRSQADVVELDLRPSVHRVEVG
jgi:hypothetical protein